MALSTYSELKTEIANWMLDSAPEVAPQADVIVALGRVYINLKLRAREMITVDGTLVITSGEATIPTYYIAPRRVVFTSGARIPLKQMTPEQADLWYPYRPSGVPAHFTIIGSKLRLYPTPADATTVELTYYKGLEPMVNDGDTDWLLTKYPNIYLSAGQMYAAEFIKEDQEAQKQALITDTLVSMVNAQDEETDLSMGEYVPETSSPV